MRKLALLIMLAACNGGPAANAPLNGFLLGRDSFSFPNYTNEGVVNLTTAEIRRMFGDGVCAYGAGDGCILTPPAQRFMDEVNLGMDGGHCFGFSHLALDFFAGKQSPVDFGGPMTSALVKDGNMRLQHEIAYWMATQYTQQNQLRSLAPSDVLPKLRASLTAGKNGEQFTLGVYNSVDGQVTGGHALTPFFVDDVDAGHARIFVYDNNHPGESRTVDIDIAADRWTYLVATDPSQPGSTYVGNALTKTMSLAPLSGAQGILPCDFCGDEAPDVSLKASRRIVVHGSATVDVADSQGRHVNAVNNDIPGADVQPTITSLGEAPPVFTIPGGLDLTIGLTGASIPTNESVSIFGPGYALGASNMGLAAGQSDSVTVAADGLGLTYVTAGAGAVMVLGVQNAGADYEVDIGLHADGNAVSMRNDSGKLALKVSKSATYDLTVRRIGDSGKSELTHAAIAIAAGDTVYLDYSGWAGQGSPISAAIDHGSDGSIDQTTTISDDDI